MDFSGIIAGAMSGGGRALQKNALGDLEKQREEALMKLEQDMGIEAIDYEYGKEADIQRAEAEAEAAQGNDSAADSLYEEAAELKQKADRRRRIAKSKTRTLQKWIRDTDAAQAISPAVDRPNELVSGMDAPAQTKRDRVQQEAEQELRQAAEKEMEHLMAHLKEQADPFLDALEKAKALDSDSATAGGFGRTLDVLSGVDVKAAGGARQGLDEKLEDVFAEYGVA